MTSRVENESLLTDGDQHPTSQPPKRNFIPLKVSRCVYCPSVLLAFLVGRFCSRCSVVVLDGSVDVPRDP